MQDECCRRVEQTGRGGCGFSNDMNRRSWGMAEGYKKLGKISGALITYFKKIRTSTNFITPYHCHESAKILKSILFLSGDSCTLVPHHPSPCFEEFNHQFSLLAGFLFDNYKQVGEPHEQASS